MATYYMKDDGKYYRKEDDERIRVGNYDIDPNEDYMSGYNKSLAVGDLNAAAEYERKRNAKIEAGYGNGYAPTYNLNYKSKYDDKIEGLRGDLENYKKFSYDPMKDDAYKSLVGVYNKNALNASKNAMTQAAIQNGGRLSSNAMVAASLAYGDQMSQLQAEIPQLRQAAYNMYLNEKNDKRILMNDYISAENENYGRWSDNYNRMYQNTWDLLNYQRQANNDVLNAKYTNAQIDSIIKNDAVQESMALGYVNENAAKILGVPVGTPTNEAVNQYQSRQLSYIDMLGRVPDGIAKSYEIDYGGNTVSRDSLSESERHNRASEANDSLAYSGINYSNDTSPTDWNNENEEQEPKQSNKGATAWEIARRVLPTAGGTEALLKRIDDFVSKEEDPELYEEVVEMVFNKGSRP